MGKAELILRLVVVAVLGIPTVAGAILAAGGYREARDGRKGQGVGLGVIGLTVAIVCAWMIAFLWPL